MCVCIKHVIVGCCFVSLLLGTSIRASAPVRIYWPGAGHHFSVSHLKKNFFCIIVEVCIQFNNFL